MKPLTTSVYTFSDLIAGGYLYVDKTAGIFELIRGYKGQYFYTHLLNKGPLGASVPWTRCRDC